MGTDTSSDFTALLGGDRTDINGNFQAIRPGGVQGTAS